MSLPERWRGKWSQTPTLVLRFRFLIASVTLPQVMHGSSFLYPGSTSSTEGKSVGLRRSSKYSFRHPTYILSWNWQHPYHTPQVSELPEDLLESLWGWLKVLMLSPNTFKFLLQSHTPPGPTKKGTTHIVAAAHCSNLNNGGWEHLQGASLFPISLTMLSNFCWKCECDISQTRASTQHSQHTFTLCLDMPRPSSILSHHLIQLTTRRTWRSGVPWCWEYMAAVPMIRLQNQSLACDLGCLMCTVYWYVNKTGVRCCLKSFKLNFFVCLFSFLNSYCIIYMFDTTIRFPIYYKTL